MKKLVVVTFVFFFSLGLFAQKYEGDIHYQGFINTGIEIPIKVVGEKLLGSKFYDGKVIIDDDICVLEVFIDTTFEDSNFDYSVGQSFYTSDSESLIACILNYIKHDPKTTNVLKNMVDKAMRDREIIDVPNFACLSTIEKLVKKHRAQKVLLKKIAVEQDPYIHWSEAERHSREADASLQNGGSI